MQICQPFSRWGRPGAASLAGLFRTFIIAIVAVYFLLVILFNSFTQPFLVMIAIPFGIIGVIAAFGFHGEPFSFMAIMGVVGLSGVVVNDSLVLVPCLLCSWAGYWSTVST